MRHKWLKIDCTLSRPFVYLPEGRGSVSHDPPVSCIFIIKRCNDNRSKEQAVLCPKNECERQSKRSYACKRDARNIHPKQMVQVGTRKGRKRKIGTKTYARCWDYRGENM